MFNEQVLRSVIEDLKEAYEDKFEYHDDDDDPTEYKESPLFRED